MEAAANVVDQLIVIWFFLQCQLVLLKRSFFVSQRLVVIAKRTVDLGFLLVAFELCADVLEVFDGVLVFSHLRQQFPHDFMRIDAQFIEGQFFVVGLEVLVEDGQGLVDVLGLFLFFRQFQLNGHFHHSLRHSFLHTAYLLLHFLDQPFLKHLQRLFLGQHADLIAHKAVLSIVDVGRRLRRRLPMVEVGHRLLIMRCALLVLLEQTQHVSQLFIELIPDCSALIGQHFLEPSHYCIEIAVGFIEDGGNPEQLNSCHLVFRAGLDDLLEECLRLLCAFLRDLEEDVGIDGLKTGHIRHGLVVEHRLVVLIDLPRALVELDGAVILLGHLVADAQVDQRIEVERGQRGILVREREDNFVVGDGLLVIADEAQDVGEVVVTDGVVGLDGDGLEVHGSGEQVLALGAVAAAHVAVGLEVAGIVHQCPQIVIDRLLKGRILLLLFPLLEAFLRHIRVAVPGGWPDRLVHVLGLRPCLELRLHASPSVSIITITKGMGKPTSTKRSSCIGY